MTLRNNPYICLADNTEGGNAMKLLCMSLCSPTFSSVLS